MPTNTPNFNLQAPQTTDNIVTTIQNLASNFNSIDNILENHASSLAEKTNISISKDRFFNYIQTTSQENSITLIGDSISEGTHATDYSKTSFAAILRRAIQKKYNNRNWGFVNFRDLVGGYGLPEFHTITKQGFTAETFDGTFYGGMYIQDSNINNFVQVSYVGKDAKLVYQGRSDGGILNVFLDGTQVGTIDTSIIGSVANGSISNSIGVTTFGQHTIKLIKADNKPTVLCGMMYYENGSTITPTFHNVGRSSITLCEIPQNILSQYCSGGAVILALGVNDQIQNKDINVFESQLSYVCNQIVQNQGSLIICDFMFSLPPNNPYKQALTQIAAQYSQFLFLDFAQLWFANTNENEFSNLLYSDGVHPTDAGHQFIAETLMKYLGLPYSKNDLVNQNYDTYYNSYFQVPTLLNNWTNFGSTYGNAGFIKDSTGKVLLRGVIKGGTTTTGTIIFTLPTGYRPVADVLYIVNSNYTFGSIAIQANGNVVVEIANNTFLSLDGIQFKAEQ